MNVICSRCNSRVRGRSSGVSSHDDTASLAGLRRGRSVATLKDDDDPQESTWTPGLAGEEIKVIRELRRDANPQFLITRQNMKDYQLEECIPYFVES